MLTVILVPVLNDNYAYILQSEDVVAIVDPGEAEPIIKKLEELSLTPSIIFNTHHHGDHIAGNQELKEKYDIKIIGPLKDKHRITEMDKGVIDGDIIPFGSDPVTIMETPGHTSGHICLWFEQSTTLFSADTLFSMGCGRTFEGTSAELFNAFERFKALPDQTKVYCGHEYTESNGEFCLTIEPDNQDLLERMDAVRTLRKSGLATIPSTIGQEKKTNIFMRAQDVAQFKKI